MPTTGRMHRAVAAALALLIASTAAARQRDGSAKPRLSELKVSVEGARVMATFELLDAFDEQLRARIDSGLPTGFSFVFNLLRDRKHWWDDGIATAELQVVAMYNAVTLEYLINRKHDGRLVESHVVRSIGELESAMTSFTSTPVFSLEGIPPGTRLLVKGHAVLGPGTVLGFIPRRKTTDDVVSRKFRVPGSPPPEE